MRSVAVVDRGQFSGRAVDFDLHDIRAGMVDLDRNLDRVAHAHRLRAWCLTLTGHGQRGDVVFAGLRLADFDFDRLVAADNAEAWRRGDFEPAVEFVFLAGQQGVYGCIKAKGRYLVGHVVDLAVRDHDDARHAVRRNVGQGLA